MRGTPESQTQGGHPYKRDGTGDVSIQHSLVMTSCSPPTQSRTVLSGVGERTDTVDKNPKSTSRRNGGDRPPDPHFPRPGTPTCVVPGGEGPDLRRGPGTVGGRVGVTFSIEKEVSRRLSGLCRTLHRPRFLQGVCTLKRNRRHTTRKVREFDNLTCGHYGLPCLEPSDLRVCLWGTNSSTRFPFSEVTRPRRDTPTPSTYLLPPRSRTCPRN